MTQEVLRFSDRCEVLPNVSGKLQPSYLEQEGHIKLLLKYYMVSDSKKLHSQMRNVQIRNKT